MNKTCSVTSNVTFGAAQVRKPIVTEVADVCCVMQFLLSLTQHFSDADFQSMVDRNVFGI